MLCYLDSSTVIDVTDPDAPRHGDVVSALSKVQPEDRCASDLVRLECMVGPLKSGDPARIADVIGFFGILRVFAIRSADCDLAARLRADHGLKTPDALHLAIALGNRCDEFWTSDRDLVKIPVALAFRGF